MPAHPPTPVRTEADIQRLEAAPFQEAVPFSSTYAFIRDSALRHADRPALSFLPSARLDDTPVRWTYADLLSGMHQTANLLHHLGWTNTDVLAVMLPAGLAYHLALWGGEAAGIVQPLNPMLTEDKLEALLRASGARALMVPAEDDDSGLLRKGRRLLAKLPQLQHLLRVSAAGQALSPDQPLGPNELDFYRLLDLQPKDQLLSRRVFAATDIAAYFHTGGTTGAPKLARHSHGAQVFTAWANAAVQGMRHDDVLINGYPLFHVAGVLPGTLCSLGVGMETVIPTPTLFRNRDVIQNYWRLVEKHRATLVSGVPTALAALVQVPVGEADIRSVRAVRTGAAALPPELASRFQQVLGLQIYESLGMTEMAGLSTVNPPGADAPAGCVGWRLPYSAFRIVALDADGQPTGPDLGQDAVGVVLFKSPNLFSGYLDDQATAQAFTADGWLISGDLGWRDAQGRLHLSGRAKDLIIRGGHNIDPKVIEDALGAHPAVQLCAAVGAPDAYAGELPVAFASLQPGAQVSEAELLAFTAERVDEAPAKPKWIHILPQMPLTNVGKIYKPELRTLATATVVHGLVAQVFGASGLPAEEWPQVVGQGDGPVQVRLKTGTPCPALTTLEGDLQTQLRALPVTINLQRA